MYGRLVHAASRGEPVGAAGGPTLEAALTYREGEAMPTIRIQVHFDGDVGGEQRFVEHQTVLDRHGFVIGRVHQKSRWSGGGDV